MATITVSFDGENLQLSDKGHTDASRSEQIFWHPGEGVKAITNVSVKPEPHFSAETFWSDAPQKTGVNFKGTINSDVEIGSIWDYDISCDVGTASKSIDPRIQVLY